MNRKMIFNMVGRIMMIEAVLLLLPMFCSLIYKETCFYSFLITAAVSLVFGALLTVLTRTQDKTIFAKEGFVIVALAWITLSAIGALPFVLSGSIPSYTDAFFETVSGFTTTGASILTDVEIMPKGILFWRSFTHWVGGMGILVLVMAIVPTDNGRSIHIMRAEMPGPIVGKLVPRIKSTAKILYLIYIFMTFVQVVLLFIGDMTLFDSLIHTFGTAGTGGFGIKNTSIAGYSPYIQWVITIFMALFGINFNLYYLILIRKFRSAFKSEELWWYVAIMLISVGIITANIYPHTENFTEALRLSAFQVSSIMTTTGYSTTDFNMWPTLSKGILLFLMFIGACAGSTAGGLKVSRIILLFKQTVSNLKHMLHPRSVKTVRFEGKKTDNVILADVSGYFVIYFICFALIFLLLCIEPFDIETNISAVAACFNNIGPGLGMVGPTGNYSVYSDFSTWLLSAAMLLGRLEIFPMILLFSPTVWFKNRRSKGGAK